MSSYDHPETFGAVPRRAAEERSDPAPAGERRGDGARRRAPRCAGGAPRGRGAPRDARRQRRGARRASAPRAALPTVTIDFDGLAAAHPRRARRRRSARTRSSRAGAAGMVYFLEACRRPAAPSAAARRGGDAAPLPAAAIARRRRSSTGVADYDVSADGQKLLYRAPRRRSGGLLARATPTSRAVAVDADATPRQASRRRRCARYIDPQRGVQADLQRSVAQPARLPLRARTCTAPTGRR